MRLEDAFKLYYVDNEGDTMLSARTSIRDLIYSELITAKMEEHSLPGPRPHRPPSRAQKERKKKEGPPLNHSFD